MNISKLQGRLIDDSGQVTLDDFACLESFLIEDNLPSNVILQKSEETELYNYWAKVFGIESLKYDIPKINHLKKQDTWLFPKEFLDFDIETYLIGLCENKEELDRVNLELELYKERNMLNLLQFIVYIVQIMRDNDVVWGVGRGSSVSSYILYKLGLHKVNSLLYNLDINEFLKD